VKTLAFFIFMLFSIPLVAQDTYYVTMIGGNVFRPGKVRIRIGDQVSGADTLTCTSVNDFLIVLNLTGRYKISPNSKPVQKSSELISFFVSENIHLHADNIRLSSKAIGGDISLTDYFKPIIVNGKEVNEKILFTDELKIPIGKMGYPKTGNDENFFFLQLTGSTGNRINKKLAVRNDSLLISREDLTFNGKLYSQADGVLQLGFVQDYSKEKKVSQIADIKPAYLSKADLVKIIRAIKLALRGTSRDEILKEIYSQLYYMFGKPDKQSIEDLYDNN
jgi:hypothetical protein